MKKHKLKSLEKVKNHTKKQYGKVGVSGSNKTAKNTVEFKMSNENKNPKSRIHFSNEEDSFIAELCSQIEKEKISHTDLNEVARYCNIQFHDKKKVRSGENLWWHIKRAKKSNNKYFEAVTITGGSPKNTAGTRLGKQAKVMHPNAIQTAIRGPAKPKTPPVLKPPKPKTEYNITNNMTPNNIPANIPSVFSVNGQHKFEIVARDEQGNIRKFITDKFTSFEDLVFALA